MQTSPIAKTLGFGLLIAVAALTSSVRAADKPSPTPPPQTPQAVLVTVLRTEGILGNPSLDITETQTSISVRIGLLQKTKDTPSIIANKCLEALKTARPNKDIAVTASSYGLDHGLHYVAKDTGTASFTYKP